MAFDYETVSVSGNDYPVYGSQDDGDVYLAASMTASDYNSSSDDDAKGQAAVSAVRWLDSLKWIGDKTDDANSLLWPRKNITDVDQNTIPIQIQQAQFELEALLMADPTVRETFRNPLVRELHAGSVGLSFFRPAQVQVMTLLPPNVMALVSQWLAGSSNAAAGPMKSGTGRHKLDDDFGFNHGI